MAATRAACTPEDAAISEAASQRCAGLRFSTDASPGISRLRDGESFAYRYPDGSGVTDAEELDRIRHLAVPPAWRDVWICSDPHGHLQATGRDAKGRKQYRYHPDWRAVREESKFGHLPAFGEALAGIRRETDTALRHHRLDRRRVLALVVRLLDETLIRVGNREYARVNSSFGLTTLQDRHVDVSGIRMTFSFRGKAGKERVVGLKDERLANVVRKLEELPGRDLFQYVGETGEVHLVTSDDVNDYLRELTGRDVTAKDFRTWGGTVIAAEALHGHGPAASTKDGEHAVVEAVAEAARHLGNTPAVCRRSYVHPAVIEAFHEGWLSESWEASLARDRVEYMRDEERALLDVLRGAAARADR